MPKINMEKFTILLHHYIARMTISNTQNIGSHQVPGTWSQIILSGQAEILFVFIVILQI